jgi:hypothetical protein
MSLIFPLWFLSFCRFVLSKGIVEFAASFPHLVEGTPPPKPPGPRPGTARNPTAASQARHNASAGGASSSLSGFSGRCGESDTGGENSSTIASSLRGHKAIAVGTPRGYGNHHHDSNARGGGGGSGSTSFSRPPSSVGGSVSGSVRGSEYDDRSSRRAAHARPASAPARKSGGGGGAAFGSNVPRAVGFAGPTATSSRRANGGGNGGGGSTAGGGGGDSGGGDSGDTFTGGNSSSGKARSVQRMPPSPQSEVSLQQQSPRERFTAAPPRNGGSFTAHENSSSMSQAPPSPSRGVRPAWAAAAASRNPHHGNGNYGDSRYGEGHNDDAESNASSVADALIAMASARKGANRTQPRGGVGY